jgi:hypothetical protein
MQLCARPLLAAEPLPGLRRLPKCVRVKKTVSLRPKSDLRATCMQCSAGQQNNGIQIIFIVRAV